FGDLASGSDTNTASGFQVSHTFKFAGTYSVVLTIADDAGQRTTTSQTVTIAAASVDAELTLTAAGTTVHADASASTPSPGASISSYIFTIVGGATFTTVPPATTHDFTGLASGTYTIQLTVQDSANIVGTTTRTITIP
ncbi:MAG TPA: PKD domain-containing protein, partial [Vicinamibacterales bacterium]|nr:PKD domain-containing protein [Vicinamibacterales bacterium]